MPGIIFGYLQDLKPLVACRLINPDADDSGLHPEIACKALVDTGATDVVIQPRHVAALGLEESGARVRNHVVGGSRELRTYTVHLMLEGRMLADRDSPFWWTCTNARAMETTLGPDYDILIGMNCLRGLDMRFNPAGWFELLLP